MAIFALGNEILKDRHDLLVQISESVIGPMEEIDSVDILGVKLFRADVPGVAKDEWCTFRFSNIDAGIRITTIVTKDYYPDRLNKKIQ